MINRYVSWENKSINAKNDVIYDPSYVKLN